MTEEQNNSQDTDPQEDAGTSFDRGSTLSIFQSDRAEDFLALAFALAIAAGVYFLV
ncbi:MAG: hypothetical protein V3R51_05995 [Gammaproteobacteria bacterium]